jgi:carboxyl-terminal processing protease
MLPVSNRGAGQFIASPDVCATPPFGVPVPYVNIGFNAMASVFAANVLTSMLPSLTVGSVIPMTVGDEAGSMHWTIKGAAVVTRSAVNVFFNFLPAATLTSQTAGNNFNAPVGLIAVPSVTNVLAMRAGAGGGFEAAAGLAEALSPDAPDAEVAGEMLAPGVGCATVARIAMDTPARLHREVARLGALGMEVLVLDLRGNPGGDLKAALEIAGDFLPEGTLLATLVDEDGDEEALYARPGQPCTLPVILWVDRGTASAAELLAGCLQAHGRALVTGEATYGKGAASVWGAGLSLRGVRVRLPDGSEIPAGGLSPDGA